MSGVSETSWGPRHPDPDSPPTATPLFDVPAASNTVERVLTAVLVLIVLVALGVVLSG